MRQLALGDNLPPIPDKLYFRIGEVSRLVGVPASVLRYWETEFPSLAPKKSGKGHRLYRRKDIELVLEVKRLLYQERYTIEGARKHLEARARQKANKRQARGDQAALFGASPTLMQEIRRELEAILALLK
ncbi:MAG: MerR family transcriptional regulator [Bryobacterales bacterium]|nr:MerR family transcriptional regulator [Bryobacteraceae bacterium]MDW8353720.1 MerR family transcriptional regulator [Bryobacterales bacterium]